MSEQGTCEACHPYEALAASLACRHGSLSALLEVQTRPLGARWDRVHSV